MSYLEKLRAASERLPRGAAFSGMTALWLHGLDVEPYNPIQATAPVAAGISTRAGMLVRRCTLEDHDVVKVRGLPATQVLRTLRELCLRASLTESVVLVDMALHARLMTTSDVLRCIGTSTGRHGIKKFRRVVSHVEPKAESPMESRLRMLLVLARLPRPEAQVTIREGRRFLGRVDLFYRANRLALEYDGAMHRESLAQDNRRQNLLVGAGVRLLRFMASDIYTTPNAVVSQVRTALAS